jgi:hypothetical protein
VTSLSHYVTVAAYPHPHVATYPNLRVSWLEIQSVVSVLDLRAGVDGLGAFFGPDPVVDPFVASSKDADTVLSDSGGCTRAITPRFDISF